jgi:dTMP kinase
MGKFKGIFITFEKTAERLGGTTQAELLYHKLLGMGVDAVLTKEPGGTAIGTVLANLLKNPCAEMSKATELFLFMADRSQHYKEVLKPNLKAGKVVISDRYYDSTLVYQGYGRGWKTAFLWRLHQATTGSLLPDLTVVMDGVPHQDISALEDADRIEKAGDSFHLKVKEGMLHLAKKDNRYILVNANRSKEDIADEILTIVLNRFPAHFSQYRP